VACPVSGSLGRFREGASAFWCVALQHQFIDFPAKSFDSGRVPPALEDDDHVALNCSCHAATSASKALLLCAMYTCSAATNGLTHAVV
jgi:hypothetical protein